MEANVDGDREDVSEKFEEANRPQRQLDNMRSQQACGAGQLAGVGSINPSFIGQQAGTFDLFDEFPDPVLLLFRRADYQMKTAEGYERDAANHEDQARVLRTDAERRRNHAKALRDAAAKLAPPK